MRDLVRLFGWCWRGSRHGGCVPAFQVCARWSGMRGARGVRQRAATSWGEPGMAVAVGAGRMLVVVCGSLMTGVDQGVSGSGDVAGVAARVAGETIAGHELAFRNSVLRSWWGLACDRGLTRSLPLRRWCGACGGRGVRWCGSGVRFPCVTVKVLVLKWVRQCPSQLVGALSLVWWIRPGPGGFRRGVGPRVR